MQKNEAVAVASAIELSGDGVTVSTVPESSQDSSLDYNEDCLLFLCYLVKFDSSANLSPNTLTLTFTNLKNPISINEIGDITITSMMQYAGDPLFYSIDQYIGETGFTPVAGTIDSSSMSTASVTGDLSTYADNQAYEVAFTLAHDVYVGGSIKLILPSAFSMSS